MTLYEKLMAVANDPSATTEERKAYREKAESLADKQTPLSAEAIARYVDKRVPNFVNSPNFINSWGRAATENRYQFVVAVYGSHQPNALSAP